MTNTLTQSQMPVTTDISVPTGGRKPIRFASVCDGISAVGCAWKPLGWQFVFKSEIEPFPSAVADHHHPEAPNLGDMTKHKDWNTEDYAIDLICGGTPCQAFSIAGLRKGLDDPRGNLTLTFLAVIAQFRPRWVVWENVPGVLSDKTGAFGSFLGGLGQLGYGFAYRILDAQYFGVAQRRRRVFVVGHLGGLWQRAAAVLFERDCLSGNPPPRRESRQRIAPTISARTKGGGGLGTDFDLDGGVIQDPVIAIQEIGKRTGVSSTNRMHGSGIGELGAPMFTLQSSAQRGIAATIAQRQVAAGNDARSVMMRGREGCAGGGKGPLLSIEKSLTLASNANDQVLFQQRDAAPDDIAHALRAEGFDASEDGTGRGTPLVPEVLAHGQGNAERVSDGSPSLTCNHEAPIAFLPDAQRQVAAMAVRRLTPRECERLQGFPDDYTLIQFKKKPSADGPRYKALGNSMAVPVMRWIGERIQQVDEIPIA